MNKRTPSTPALPNASGLDDMPRGRTHRRLVLHLVVALLGGYLFTWGVTTLGVTALVALGVDFHEAETLLLLLAFLIFLAVFLWAFATRLVRAGVALGGGAVFMTAAAWGLQRFLLS